MTSKTLYVNINNEQIQSNEELEVLKHDLDSDFFFYLGEKIAKGCKVENENALITDFNTQDNAEDYQKIIAQWHELKTILFSEECEGEFKFTLPNGYIHWLRYSEKYNHVHDKNFSHGESPVISIDLEELYEESVEDMQRKVLRTLKRNDLYLGVDEIVFNDDAIIRKSSIVRTIKDKYEGVGFKAYKKWLQENEEKLHTTPQVCEKCKKNPCECNIEDNDLFPFLNVVLGETSIDEIVEGNLQFEEYNGFKAVQCEDFVFITNPYSDIIATLQLNEIPVVGHDFPKILSDKLGVDWATSYDDCQKELLKRNYTIRLKRKDVEIDGENYNIIVAEDPNHKYILELIFIKRSSRKNNKGYLNTIHIHLKKCPNCGEENVYIVTDKFPFTYQCKNNKCGHEWTLIPKETENEIGTPNCPNCSSDDVDDDGSDYLQYTCNDCGHNWGHDDTVECPECGSDDVENDGTDNLQYECNMCGHMWGSDEDSENEYYDNDVEDEYNDDTDNAGNQMSEYYDALNIIVGKTTKSEILKEGGIFVKSKYGENADYYEMPNGTHVQLYKDSVCVVRFHKDTWNNIPYIYKNIGLFWGIDKANFRHIFENLGFDVYEHNSIYIYASKYCEKFKKSIYLEVTYIGGEMVTFSIK